MTQLPNEPPVSWSDEMTAQEAPLLHEVGARRGPRSVVAWAIWAAAGGVGVHRVYLRRPSPQPLVGLLAIAALAWGLLSGRRRVAISGAGLLLMNWLFEGAMLPGLIAEQRARVDLAVQAGQDAYRAAQEHERAEELEANVRAEFR